MHITTLDIDCFFLPSYLFSLPSPPPSLSLSLSLSKQENTQADDEQAIQQLPHSEENEQGQAEEEGQEGVTMRGQEATPALPPLQQQQQQPPPVEEPPPPRPGALRTILIFVTTFFTSLVPQQRPELQFN